MGGMDILPLVLGGMLGLGVVLVFQGVRIMRAAAGEEGARRRGFWRLNAGLLLVGVSMIAFARTGGA